VSMMKGILSLLRSSEKISSGFPYVELGEIWARLGSIEIDTARPWYSSEEQRRFNDWLRAKKTLYESQARLPTAR